MSRKVMVKVCGTTSETDALLAVGLGADAIGFVFAPSPRQVSPSTVADIVKRVPHGVLTVGVFRDEAPSRVVDIAHQAGLGAVQLHGHETAEECRWVAARVRTTIKAFPAGDRTIDRFPDFGAGFLLVDGSSPGSGQVFDWRLAEGVADPGTMFVSGGLRPHNVGEAIARLRPYGVDVCSGVESEPGRKDPQKLRDFVAAVREAQSHLLSRPVDVGTGFEEPDHQDGEGDDPGEPADAAPGADGEASGEQHRHPGGRTEPYDWMDA